MVEGFTVIELPVPTHVVPQLLVYQFQVADVPSVPPTTVNVELPPLQIGVVPVIEVGAVDTVPFDVTIKSDEFAEHPLKVAFS